jgi:prepilin-type N-terminal cleavage/methylation domain-containing protein
MKFALTTNRARRAGFTLIELVVVLAILAALAGLIIPKVDFLKASSESASSASNMQDITSNLQLYRTTKSRYPMGMDSLLDTSGAIYSGLWNHTAGVPPSSLEVIDGSSLFTAMSHSLEYSSEDSGFVVYDHSATSTNYSNSATLANKRVLTGTAGSTQVVAIKAGNALLTKLGVTDPASVPATTRFLCFGVGPNTKSVGTTMTVAPLSSGIGAVTPATNYCRYIAVYEVNSAKNTTKLRGVLDPLLNNIDARLTGYYNNQPD